jgi:SAM-dependent methyltransferase
MSKAPEQSVTRDAKETGNVASNDQANDPSQQRKAEWAARVEGFARDAAPKTRPFAATLVDFVSPEPGARVLDIATGSGVVAVEAALRVGPEGSVLATDFVPEWEPYVAATAAEAGVANVTFAVMPAEALVLPDASFDAVLCQFGLMSVAEPVEVLRGMRRVLRPGGQVGISVWSVPEKVGLFLISGIVAAALPPPEGDPPPSPMSLGAPGLLEGLVAEAGFDNVVVERVTCYLEIADPEAEWRKWGEDPVSPIIQGLKRLPEARQAELRAEAIAALEAYRDGDVIRLPSEAILVKGCV